MEGTFPVPLPNLFVSNGWIFTEFFFIISGFLFAKSCKKYLEKGVSLPQYMVGRMKKIYIPALFATMLDVIVRLVLTIISGQDYGLSVSRIIKTITFSDTLVFNEQPFPSVLWYVHVLMFCYFVYYILLKQNKTIRVAGGVILLFLSWYIAFSDFDYPFIFQNVGRGMFAFLIGIITNIYQESISDKTKYVISIVANVICILIKQVLRLKI